MGGSVTLIKNSPLIVLFRVPLTEFESVTFCSASKRSIQLRYRGNPLPMKRPIYTAARANRQGIITFFNVTIGRYFLIKKVGYAYVYGNYRCLAHSQRPRAGAQPGRFE